MIQLSIILSFILGGTISPGGKLLKLLFSPATFRNMSLIEQYILMVSFYYIIPATIIYIALRFSGIDNKIKKSRSTSILFSIAIILCTAMIGVKYYAATIPGGGMSFAVSHLGLYVVGPAWVLMIIGLVLTIKNSQLTSQKSNDKTPLSTNEKTIIPLILAIPLIPVVLMFISQDGVLRLAYNTEKVFDEECELAVDSISTYPTDLQGIFVENIIGSSYEKISFSNKYQTYRSVRTEVWLKKLLDEGTISFIEIPNRSNDYSKYKYIYYDQENRKGKKVNQLKSTYVAKWEKKKIMPKTTAINQTTIKIVNLNTSQTIATTKIKGDRSI